MKADRAIAFRGKSKLKKFALVLLLFSTLSFANNKTDEKPLALVWFGPGACVENCARAAAHMARLAGFKVQHVTSENFSQALLDEAKLWVQPGGDAIAAAKDMGVERLQMLRAFVDKGGRYVGFCAGAFLADHWVDDFNTVPGLGITPVVTEDYAKDQVGLDELILDVNWEGKLRHLYFNTGGTFRPETATPDVKVLAYFQTEGMPVLPAAWENTFGAGRVVVTGTHPEAPPKWREDLNKVDEDGDDYDLALEMIRRAMAPR
jgi:glutamine amidotransferase-like uncharacterized protein